MTKNTSLIEISIEGAEALDKVEIILQKYLELTENLNRLSELGINKEVIENILIAVKPIYENSKDNT